MDTSLRFPVFVCLIFCLMNGLVCSSIKKLAVRMPGVRPSKPDSYLCTSVKVSNQEQYIVHFEPKASMDVAHHMLLFGCKVPGSARGSWKCFSMTECLSKPKILFAWGRNAAGRDLPKDVGFKIGGTTDINYLVLQVHYGNVDNLRGKPPDHSGFILHTTTTRQKYTAGIYLLWGAVANIRKESKGEHVDIACTYDQDEPMYGFAFRTHTHTLGRVVTGYRIRNGEWKLLGKGNPQAPQAFYPMNEVKEIKKGDELAARCTYDSVGHHLHNTVHMGSKSSDEMCNFYMMYYQKSSEFVDDENMDCGLQGSKKLFAQSPSGSDTALPKGVNYQAEEVPSDLDFGLNGDKRLTTLAPPVARTVPTTESVAVVKGGNSDQDALQPSTGEQIVRDHTPSVHHAQQAGLHVVTGWPKLSRDNVRLGQVSGVAVTPTGDVTVFHRASRDWDARSFDANNRFNDAGLWGPIDENTILVLSPDTGRVLWQGGKNFFYLPHGLTVDHKNNLWVTDVAKHQVFKFQPRESGKGWHEKPVLTLGRLLEPGSDKEHFCKPTDVAVLRNGEFFVSDGYCNSRIMKFSSEGKLLLSWGVPSKRMFGIKLPGPGTFNIPHSLALDDSHHRLYVADRENGRVQSFDTRTGTFQKEISLPEFEGRVFAVDFSKRHGGVLHVVNGPALDSRRVVTVQGFTVAVDDGKLLNAWPVGSGKGPVALSQPHDVASSADGSAVYVVEIGPNKIWKFEHTSHVTTQASERNNNMARNKEKEVVAVPVKPKTSAVQDENDLPGTKPPATTVDHTVNVNTAQRSTIGASNTTLSSAKTPVFIKIHAPSPTAETDPTSGVIPALIILSVLAVPIIFLLCISIVLRIRAYRRDRYRHVKFGEVGMKGDLAVSRSRGWCSYLNCCDKRKYGFDKVTLNDFYSDSDSEGI